MSKGLLKLAPITGAGAFGAGLRPLSCALNLQKFLFLGGDKAAF